MMEEAEVETSEAGDALDLSSHKELKPSRIVFQSVAETSYFHSAAYQTLLELC